MTPQPFTSLAHRVLKGVALLQLLGAGAIWALDIKVSGHSSWSIAAMMIAGALVMLFCAQETVNDERIEQLKLRACKIGLLFGVLIAMFTNLFATMSGASMPLSAFDVLIVIMLIALGCFYLWRWQDSRPLPKR